MFSTPGWTLRLSPVPYQPGGFPSYVSIINPRQIDDKADEMAPVIYTAATVLLAERLRPTDAKTGTLDQKRKDVSWDRAIELLRAYSRVGPSAERCITALGLLAARIPAASHADVSRVVAEDDAYVVQPEDVAETGATSQLASHTADFEHLDFNINDMFWLNTSAADIIFDPFSSR